MEVPTLNNCSYYGYAITYFTFISLSVRSLQNKFMIWIVVLLSNSSSQQSYSMLKVHAYFFYKKWEVKLHSLSYNLSFTISMYFCPLHCIQKIDQLGHAYVLWRMHMCMSLSQLKIIGNEVCESNEKNWSQLIKKVCQIQNLGVKKM